MLGQIIIGSVRNTPQFAPSEGEQELNIGGSLTVEAQDPKRWVWERKKECSQLFDQVIYIWKV